MVFLKVDLTVSELVDSMAAQTVVPWAFHLVRSCTPFAALLGNRTCTAAPPAPRSCFRIAATCMTLGCLVRENYRSCKWRANVRLHCIPRTTTSPLQRSSQSHTACSSKRLRWNSYQRDTSRKSCQSCKFHFGKYHRLKYLRLCSPCRFHTWYTCLSQLQNLSIFQLGTWRK